ncbi:MAG: aminotransferase class IV [Parachlamydiaceae bacterium]
MFLYYSGQSGSASTLKIPFLERIFIGDGIFRTIKVQEGKIDYLEEHFAQLKRECALSGIAAPFLTKDVLYEFMVKSQADVGAWRLKIIVVALTRRIAGPAASDYFLTLQPYDEEKKELRLISYPHPMEKSLAKLKTISYLEYDQATTYAKRKGFDDALLLNSKRQLLECGKANLIWFYEDRVFFVSPQLTYYQGVMQTLCLKASQALKIAPCPCKIQINEIPSQAFLFATNSLQGPLPVIQIGNKSYSRCQHLEIKLKEALARLT